MVFGVLNSAVFKSFHNRVEFGTILVGLQNFGGGEFEPPLGTPLILRAVNEFLPMLSTFSFQFGRDCLQVKKLRIFLSVVNISPGGGSHFSFVGVSEIARAPVPRSRVTL